MKKKNPRSLSLSASVAGEQEDTLIRLSGDPRPSDGGGWHISVMCHAEIRQTLRSLYGNAALHPSTKNKVPSPELSVLQSETSSMPTILSDPYGLNRYWDLGDDFWSQNSTPTPQLPHPVSRCTNSSSYMYTLNEWNRSSSFKVLDQHTETFL